MAKLNRRPRSRAQATVEFALMSGGFFLLLMGILDFGRAIGIYIAIAEAAHEGARQLVLRSNQASQPPDPVIINATLATIGGGGIVLTEDPCLSNPTPCSSPSTPTSPNSGYIWLTPNRHPGNAEVTVRVTYLFAPMTGLIANATGPTLLMTASSSMRAEY